MRADLLIAAAAAATVAVFLVCAARGVRAGVWIAILVASTIVPLLLTHGTDIYHVGIADAVPGVRTYTVLLVALTAIGLVALRHAPMPLALVAFVCVLAVLYLAVWPRSSFIEAGVLQLLIGICGWYVGSAWGGGSPLREREASAIATTVLGIVVAQIIFAAVQLSGHRPSILTPVDAALLGNRVNGTANHPDTLGKLLFMVMLVGLWLIGSGYRSVSRKAAWAVGLAYIPLLLSQGRANIVAAIVLTVFWGYLLPRDTLPRARTAALFGGWIVGMMSLGVLASRFDEDPTGGVRGQLLTNAYGQLHRTFWLGTGPNNYTNVVGPLTGSWIPVHNSFLLLVAEVGAIGAAAFFVGLVVIWARAWGRRRATTPQGAAARVLIASIPGVVLIGMTGWGLFGTSVLALWMFVYGALYSTLRWNGSVGLVGSSLELETARRAPSLELRSVKRT
ncbi:O-antigen ligase family protein [Cellulomonas alba]|uniref:O-antigen ligase family protein n=1 Tax=Cellulomonas alba TaxID=3053467 RepID=A0ABT7SH10_9CELL|nr:O-antigen ligase family protein [Cellulomonas alba]MDM7855456.1 O-antigen ligase family protein [Cellulomonas alba]